MKEIFLEKTKAVRAGRDCQHDSVVENNRTGHQNVKRSKSLRDERIPYIQNQTVYQRGKG